ncbi:hypothetical protein [Alicyclobacillus fastidiosus]|uniref:Uncharacterized protein n=1 Tax=Alicyclobacillus fastidiosus TaxID=392011 RepID=A0ABV5AA38_9BACL|nr:hypothetical protein [Alicyclobacillus fastidiosus]WEH10973.1 hypothetical protein PYS47_07085 [Alicyclobacillus fastidiosus]
MMSQQSAAMFLQAVRSEIQKQMGGGNRKRVPKPAVMGTIDPNYSTGLPNVIFDDDTSRTPVGPYPHAGSYTPQANDRVMLLQVGNSGKYVILDKVVYQ